MIIPPDPEKDPNIYASSSTPSLLPSDAALNVQPPDAVHYRNSAFGYPFDDGWRGEQLPPYEGSRARWSSGLRGGDRSSTASLEDVFSDSYASDRRHPPHIIIPSIPLRSVSQPGPSSPTSSSSSLTPTGPTPRSHFPPPESSNLLPSSSTTLMSQPIHGSTSKLWENPSSQTHRRKRRTFLCLPIPSIPNVQVSPRTRKFWKKYRRWIQASLIFLLIGMGLCAGLLVGLRVGAVPSQPVLQPLQPWNDQDKNGRKIMSWSPNTSLNLTYVASRDGPAVSDGTMSLCNNFTSVNSTTSPFSLLSTPFSSANFTVASFNVPANTSDLYFVARGLGALGTLEFIGSDAPLAVAPVVSSIHVDVVIRYTGTQDVASFMKVCQMSRSNGLGVGVYSPVETDGKVSNPALLDPTQLPSLHILVRLPPPPLYLPSLSIGLDRMSIRFGDMQNLVDFGSYALMTGKGSVDANYVAAKNATVLIGSGSIRGTWNVSRNLNLNTTDGGVFANVILFDPDYANDNSSTLAGEKFNLKRSIAPVPRSPLTQHDHTDPTRRINTLNTGNVTIFTTHHISNVFEAGDGPVIVSYIHHPPTTSVSTMLIADSGEVDLSLHPNYVGPFAARNIWGQVRLVQPDCPPIAAYPAPDVVHACVDPQSWGRTRRVSTGIIDLSDQLYQDIGLNTSMLTGFDIVSGAAYWSDRIETPIAVQNATEGRGNGMVVSGRWGDVRISFDGT